MALTITESRIESEDTDHYAEHVGSGMWCVTWLLNRVLDRNQAITAMTLAEEVANSLTISADFGLIRSLASELDLLGSEATAMILIPPAEGKERSDP